MRGLDVGVTVVAAFGAGMLAGIGFHGDDEFGFGFDAPHGIDEIAGILSAKLQPELAAHLAGTERFFAGRFAKIGEASFDILRGGESDERAHLGDVNGQAIAGSLLDSAFGHTEFCMRNGDPASGRSRFDRSDGGREHNADSKKEIGAILVDHNGDVSLQRAE